MLSAMSREVNATINDLSNHPILLHIHVSNVTLLLIDWIFALDIEITHAWGGPWNMGRILYFITRYSAFLDAMVMLYYRSASSVLPPLCGRLHTVRGILLMLGVGVAELIMTIRVWALWGRRQDIGVFLVIISIVNATISFVTYMLLGQPYQYVVMNNLSSNVPGCFPIIAVGLANSWSFIPLVVHQTLIFGLTAIKGIHHYWDGVYGTSLINTFYRDGITYYALLVAFSIANLAARSQLSDIAEPYFLTFLQRTIHSILSARMLLHLRQESSTSHDSRSLTSLRFAAMERPSSTSSIPAAHFPEELGIPRIGWFGEEESPSHRPQSAAPPAAQV